MTTIAQWIATHVVAFGDVRFYPIDNGGNRARLLSPAN